MTLRPTEAKRLVREGYDRCASSYLDVRTTASPDLSVLERFQSGLPDDARVLDAGCGAGIPVAHALGAAGCRVLGVDFSARQLTLAAERTPELLRTQADLTALPFATASFDAIVSYYAVIHIPREEHAGVLGELRRVLRDGGRALLCLGANDLPADHDNESWLGVEMYWSHYDAGTNLELVAAAGFTVDSHELVPDPLDHGQHLFVHATAS